MATGEVITFEEVGGVDVHARRTGQIDLGVDTDEEAYAAIRRWLSLPAVQRLDGGAPGRAGRVASSPTPELAALVPAKRTRGYDMRRVVARLCRSRVACSSSSRCSPATSPAPWPASTAGPSASWPTTRCSRPGSSTPRPATRSSASSAVCDAFNLPVIFLVDVPGFMVGQRVEHGRILHLGMRMMQALQNAG